MGMLFFGIEELGVQIEEPFSILPLEDFVAAVESAGMLAARPRRLGQISLAPPYSPSSQATCETVTVGSLSAGPETCARFPHLPPLNIARQNWFPCSLADAGQ